MDILYTHACVCDRRFRGASPVYPTPRKREMGFVSSLFSCVPYVPCVTCVGPASSKSRGGSAKAKSRA